MLSRPEQSVRCGLGIGFGGVPCQIQIKSFIVACMFLCFPIDPVFGSETIRQPDEPIDNKHLKHLFPHFLNWMQDSRPGKSIPGVIFYLETFFLSNYCKILHPEPKVQEKRTYQHLCFN